MKGFICRFHRDEGGATAIEYGLICALLFVVILVGVSLIAGRLGGMFQTAGDVIGGAAI